LPLRIYLLLCPQRKSVHLLVIYWHYEEQPRRDERYRIPEGAIFLIPVHEFVSHSHHVNLFEVVIDNSETGTIDFRLHCSGRGQGFYHYYV